MEMSIKILEDKGEIRAGDIDLGVVWCIVQDSVSSQFIALRGTVFFHHPLARLSTERSCGRILIGLDGMPNPMAKTVGCLDWQPLWGPFTWKDYFPKGIRVPCKATNIATNVPQSTHFFSHLVFNKYLFGK